MTDHHPTDDEISMLALFRQELRNQLEEMERGIDRCQHEKATPTDIESLIRIAHSIKGASKLVGIEKVCELASVLEGYFQKMHKNQLQFDLDDWKKLDETIEILKSIQNSEPQMLFQAVSEVEQKIDALVGCFQSRGQTKQGEKGGRCLQSQSNGGQASNQSFDQLISEMMRLYTVLKEENAHIQEEAGSQEGYKKLIEAAEKINGLGEQFKLPIIQEVGEALTECYRSAAEDRFTWTQGHMDLILELIYFIDRLGRASSNDVISIIEKSKANIDSIVHVLLAISRETTGYNPNQSVSREFVDEESGGEKRVQPEVHEEVVDDKMLDLFYTELENRIRELNYGLLELEKKPEDDEALEGLMRAAHSIKGAARIVELNPVIRLSHVLEDLFIGAQKKQHRFTSKKIDKVFLAVDLLSRVLEVPPKIIQTWMNDNQEYVENLVVKLSNSFDGDENSDESFIKSEPVTHVKRELTVPKNIPKKNKASDRESSIKITPHSINRLMGLAGDAYVQTRWLEPFMNSIYQTKCKYDEIVKQFDHLQNALKGPCSPEVYETHIHDIKTCMASYRNDLDQKISELEAFIRRMGSVSHQLYHQVINSRMLPFQDGVESFPRLVRQLAQELNKKAHLIIEGKDTPVDREILEKLEAPLNHLIRNAIDHGIETVEERKKSGKNEEGMIRLSASHKGGMLQIEVRDDGRGVNFDKLREMIVKKNFVSEAMAEKLSDKELLDFMFLPGFSTADTVTELSGRGVGLNVVQSMVHDVGGVLRCFVSGGLCFQMQLPLTLSVIRSLIVKISDENYALPIARIEKVLHLSLDETEIIENRRYFVYRDHNVGLIPAFEFLELPPKDYEQEDFCVVVISDHLNYYGIIVDEFVGEKQLVVQDLDQIVGKIQDIAAGALMEDGSVVLIIDVEDMVRSIDKILAQGAPKTMQFNVSSIEKKGSKRVLVVDDSITVREVECRLLENKGYAVETAVNGVDGWNALRIGQFDLVITDVDMPRMNGIEFVKRIRSDPKYKDLPLMIVSYKEGDQDKKTGLEAGANYYLTKSSFHDETLLEAVDDLIGSPSEEG